MSTPADFLRAHLDDIDQRLEHFARVRREYVPYMRAFLQDALRVSPERTAAAVRVSQERSQKIEAGIRLAVGAAPLSQRGLAGMVQRRIERRGPEEYGLRAVPCLRVIRRVLSAMKADQAARNMCISITTVSPERERAGYASTVHQSATLQST